MHAIVRQPATTIGMAHTKSEVAKTKYETSDTGFAVCSVFGWLFLVFLIASIVCCCCRCCYADELATPPYTVVSPGPYPQEGPHYVAPVIGQYQYPQGGKV